MNALTIERWICRHLQRALEIDEGDFDPLMDFDALGLDSAAAIGLVGELEDWLGIELDPTLAYDYPNARALAAAIAAIQPGAPGTPDEG